MEIADAARVAGTLAGVRLTVPGGLAEWRYHGRLVAGQLDDTHVVIRADFDYRAGCCGSSPRPSASRPGTAST